MHKEERVIPNKWEWGIVERSGFYKVECWLELTIKCRWSTVDVEWRLNDDQHPMACKIGEKNEGGKLGLRIASGDKL